MPSPSACLLLHRPRALGSVVAASMAIAALLGCSPARAPEPRAPEPAVDLSETQPGETEHGGEAATGDLSATGATGSESTGSDPFADPAPAAPPDSEPAAGAPTAGTPAPRRGDGEASEGMISFFEIGRGDRVADLGGLFGYSLEPMLDAVGGAGVVYARLRPGLSPDAIPYSKPDRSHQGELIWMKTPMTAPFTRDAKRLNAVTLLFAYHSVIAAGQSRRALNDSVYQALVPGGTYIIVDHAAPPGSGLAAAASLHRIEDHIVRAEVEASGFRFVESADFVTNAARPAGQAAPSQYVLKFEKPK